MKRSRADVLAMFGSRDAIEQYVYHDFGWAKKKMNGHAIGIPPLKLLMPLMIVRTVGFLKRSMPAPFGDKRIPNFQPFLDRVTLETYLKVKELKSSWEEAGSNVRGYLLCTILLITQIDMYYVKKLLSSHYQVILEMDAEAIISILEDWHNASTTKRLFRSRFIAMHMAHLKSLLRCFVKLNVPFSNVPDFVRWLQQKENGKKVFEGCGPFVPMVLARELVLYNFFPTVGCLTSLGAGQGSYQLFIELGKDPSDAIAEMRNGFIESAKEEWAKYVKFHPDDAKWSESIQTLLFRTPTDFELENMGCEGRKMLKIIKEELGLLGGKRIMLKSFYTTLPNGQLKESPPMNRIPLPKVVDGGMVVEEVALV